MNLLTKYKQNFQPNLPKVGDCLLAHLHMNILKYLLYLGAELEGLHSKPSPTLDFTLDLGQITSVLCASVSSAVK